MVGAASSSSGGGGGGECVEVRFGPGDVLVRDSKGREGPMLRFTHSEWRAFLAGAVDGEFDIPAATS